MDFPARSRRSGMTLVELLVVVAVLAALLALLLPAVQAVREAGRRVACMNNLRGIGCAIYGHESARRAFPVGCLECTTKAPRRQIAWNAFILPYLEEPGAAAAFDIRFSYRSGENRQAAGHVVRAFLCPSTTRTRPRPGPSGQPSAESTSPVRASSRRRNSRAWKWMFSWPRLN